MTKVVASHSIDMLNTSVFFGTVSSYSSTQISIVAGAYTAQYLGNFTYDNWGNVFGQLNGYVFKISGVVQYTVSEMNTDAYQAFADVQSGNISALYVRALSGADSFVGSDQADSLLGFAGRDLLNGNGGDDVLRGGIDADRLIGGFGNDSLLGEDGFDRLAGGFGKDSMTGGTGNDEFVFNTALSDFNRDRIADFAPGHDRIILENSGAGLFNGLLIGGLLEHRFKDTATGSVDGNDRILYNSITGVLSYDSDGSGSAAAVVFALVENHPTISAADFAVI